MMDSVGTQADGYVAEKMSKIGGGDQEGEREEGSSQQGIRANR